jgi:hypothetical protein
VSSSCTAVRAGADDARLRGDVAGFTAAVSSGTAPVSSPEDIAEPAEPSLRAADASQDRAETMVHGDEQPARAAAAHEATCNA